MSEAAVLGLEARLRTAMLAGDADAIDRLLTDDCLFTDQNGATIAKADDLAMHRSGMLRIERLDPSEPTVRLIGDAAAVAVTMRVEGRFGDQPFAGDFAYTRLWSLADGRVVAAHCSGPVAPAPPAA